MRISFMTEFGGKRKRAKENAGGPAADTIQFADYHDPSKKDAPTQRD